jgi:hypothetical protein
MQAAKSNASRHVGRARAETQSRPERHDDEPVQESSDARRCEKRRAMRGSGR